MINAIFWIIIGALSGWIGYLATRNSEKDHILPYMMIGMAGGLMGGGLYQILGLSDGSLAVDTGSIFNALIFSALLIAVYVILLNFFGGASSSQTRGRSK